MSTPEPYKFLHNVPARSDNFYLDSRLVPEVRAMLAAMSSRMPLGGVQARYQQLIDAVEVGGHQTLAEDRLCEYPLHPKVQKFFDDFVGSYGHSSIMELTGEPCVFSQNLSWVSAWLLFDSPLCSGQEFSTRAIQHKGWPMAQECYKQSGILSCCPGQHHHGKFCLDKPDPDLKAIHDGWLEIYEAEVAWWTEHLSVPENRAALGIADKEPFRPALDRARWALPGTISTGCAHTGNLRERSRVLSVGQAMATGSGKACEAVWSNLTETYKSALPGMAQYGLREAVYGDTRSLPYHLTDEQFLAPMMDWAKKHPVEVGVAYQRTPSMHLPIRECKNTYADPIYNQMAQVSVRIDCSIAVARDWHRHRTMYPWTMYLLVDMAHVTEDCTQIQIDSHYTPMSDLGKRMLPVMLRRSSVVFHELSDAGKHMLAALALPLGTAVRIQGAGGLRDVLYTLELRAEAHGGCFEYKEQANAALGQLREKLTYEMRDALKI